MFKIITNPNLVETIQCKFPKKKKNRRWDKKYKKYIKESPMQSFYFLKKESALICHPSIREILEKKLEDSML